MKIRPPINLRHRWLLLLTAALAVVASVGAVVAIVVVFSKPATSGPGSPVARFDITPLPFRPPATVQPPDTSNPPRCQAPQDDRPAPDLPPLPCRYSGAEPPPGAIPTPAANEVLTPTNAPEKWQIVDNPVFRYTLAVPPDWYVNMRPEGGEFYVLDPVALAEEAKGGNPPGGVALHFTAELYVRVEPPFASPVDVHLDAPNASFGRYPGAIWEEPAGGEGLARIVHTAFVKDGILFKMLGNFGDGLSDADVGAEVALVEQILATITPY
jgi:hypothetical protein